MAPSQENFSYNKGRPQQKNTSEYSREMNGSGGHKPQWAHLQRYESMTQGRYTNMQEKIKRVQEQGKALKADRLLGMGEFICPRKELLFYLSKPNGR